MRGRGTQRWGFANAGAALLAVAALVVTAVHLVGASRGRGWEVPRGKVAALWDSRQAAAVGSLPRMDTPGVRELVERSAGRFAVWDLAQGPGEQAIATADVVLLHPSALASLSEGERERLQWNLARGRVIVWLDADPGPFFRMMGIRGIGLKPATASATTLAGVAVQQRDGAYPHVAVIGVGRVLPSYRDRVILNALVAYTNALLTPPRGTRL